MIELEQVRLEQVVNLWLDIEHYIKAALDYSDDRYNLDDIKELVLAEKMQLWVFWDIDYFEFNIKPRGIIVSEILQYPRKRVAQIVLLSCDKFNVCHYPGIKTFSHWAKVNDCINIDINGRFGWERKLKGTGFKKLFTTMSKEL